MDALLWIRNLWIKISKKKSCFSNFLYKIGKALKEFLLERNL